jgi:hypothetical protein
MTKGRFARKLSVLAATSALAAGFWVAAARPLRGQAAADSAHSAQAGAADTAGHSYWKHPDYDAVLDLWNCPERGICLKIHALNAEDPKVRALAAKDVKKDVKDLTPEDMQKFCGYTLELHDMKQKDGKWQGRLYVRSRNQNFGVEIQPPAAGGDGKLRMRGYVIEGFWHKLALGNPGGILGRTIEFAPVAEPPPSCRPAPKPPAP